MKEIENCQRLSMGPNFVVMSNLNMTKICRLLHVHTVDWHCLYCEQVFLGQKYGYRPIPTYILASELAQFREILLTMGQEVILLDTWYKKDSNAVPPICILQPISSILVNFNNKVCQPKLRELLSYNRSLLDSNHLMSCRGYRSCNKKIKPNGGIPWIECRNYWEKLPPHSMLKGSWILIQCIIT